MVAVLNATTALLLSLFLLLTPVVPQVTAPPPTTDATALLLLKSSFTNATALSSWSSAAPSLPCDGPSHWLGVVCNHGIVVGLRLSNLGLSGSIDVAALSHFKGLRTISLNNNSFFGPLPAALGSLGALKSLFLSHNHFSGPIADDLFRGMRRLKKLWLDHNDFSGPIPSSLSNASPLIELRLDHNGFDGPIPALELHSLAFFDASNNHLTGPIPASFARFNASSFAGNQGLCGPPVDSNPDLCAQPMNRGGDNRKKVSIAVAVLLLVFVMLLGVYVGVRKERKAEDFDKLRVASSFGSMESVVAVSMASSFNIGSGHKVSGSRKGRKGRVAGVDADGESTDLIVVNEHKGVFRLSDLMKANAEVLGNGSLGSAYKAVMSNNLSVAVKRMRDMNRTDKDAFDSQMRRLGDLRHHNVLTPLAYHYRREEKLIISEYVPKGSLLYILHGDRGRDHKALDWTTRVRIARGIARGLAYLHRELVGGGLTAEGVPHGNMKSGNVLLREDFEPMLVDFGLEGLVNEAYAPTAMFAYKSPEGQQHRRVSAKSDVFCLGVVLLELITGKFPAQYLNNARGGTDVVQWATSAMTEERELDLVDQDMAGAKQAWGVEMARFLKLGVTCTEANLEQRPEIWEVSEVLEEIAAAVGVAPGPEGAAAHGASPALLEDELI